MVAPLGLSFLLKALSAAERHCALLLRRPGLTFGPAFSARLSSSYAAAALSRDVPSLLAVWALLDAVHSRVARAPWPAASPSPADARYAAALAASVPLKPLPPALALSLSESRFACLVRAHFPASAVYTWPAAAFSAARVAQLASLRTGHAIVLDSQHAARLRHHYFAAPLAFWALLDRFLGALSTADWAGVRSDPRFIQSLLARAADGPLPLRLSPDLAEIVPRHPLVPHGCSPVLLLSSIPAVRSASTMRLDYSHCRFAARLDACYPYTWAAATAAMHAIETRISSAMADGRRLVFDEKHIASLYGRWSRDPQGFFSVLDQLHERLTSTNWNAVHDVGGYVQSLVHRFEPQCVLSRFMQTFITPPDVAARNAEAEKATAHLVDIDWTGIATLLLPRIERETSAAVGRVVRFDEKHIQHLKQRYDRDASAFWSILDQVQARMAESDWSNVRDDGRFIQSFITKAEPRMPLRLSPVLRELLVAIHVPPAVQQTSKEQEKEQGQQEKNKDSNSNILEKITAPGVERDLSEGSPVPEGGEQLLDTAPAGSIFDAGLGPDPLVGGLDDVGLGSLHEMMTLDPFALPTVDKIELPPEFYQGIKQLDDSGF